MGTSASAGVPAATATELMTERTSPVTAFVMVCAWSSVHAGRSRPTSSAIRTVPSAVAPASKLVPWRMNTSDRQPRVTFPHACGNAGASLV